ncbi:MAG: hypothetical protein V1870_04370 [Candidatus Aenigmatarchaeota archaeon]
MNCLFKKAYERAIDNEPRPDSLRAQLWRNHIANTCEPRYCGLCLHYYEMMAVAIASQGSDQI